MYIEYDFVGILILILLIIIITTLERIMSVALPSNEGFGS